MPRSTVTVYTDAKGREVLRQEEPETRKDGAPAFALQGIYGAWSVKDCVRIHAALGELLTDLAAEGKLPTEEKAKEPAVV